MEFVRCPSEFSPLTVGLCLVTNTKNSVFLSICLIPAKRISGSFLNTCKYFLFYCIYRLTLYWLRFIIRSTGILLVLKSLNSSGKYPQIVFTGLYICFSYFSEKVLSGWRMNGRKELVVSQMTTKIPSQIYGIKNRTHLVKLRRAKSCSLWSQYLYSRRTLQLAVIK